MKQLKATELRIGNYYRYLHEESESIHTVDVEFLKIQHAYDIDPDADEFARGWWSAPIPLTEAWLIKFGFEQSSESDYYRNYRLPNGISISYCLKSTVVGERGQFITGESFDEIETVHWLQNYIYFRYKYELTFNK